MFLWEGLIQNRSEVSIPAPNHVTPSHLAPTLLPPSLVFSPSWLVFRTLCWRPRSLLCESSSFRVFLHVQKSQQLPPSPTFLLKTLNKIRSRKYRSASQAPLLLVSYTLFSWQRSEDSFSSRGHDRQHHRYLFSEHKDSLPFSMVAFSSLSASSGCSSPRVGVAYNASPCPSSGREKMLFKQ